MRSHPQELAFIVSHGIWRHICVAHAIVTKIKNIGNKFASLSLEIQNIKNMLMPTDIDQQFGRTFIELTKWMNNLRGFNIQNEAPYITKMFSLYEK